MLCYLYRFENMSRGSPDNKKEAPTHVSELAGKRVIVPTEAQRIL